MVPDLLLVVAELVPLRGKPVALLVPAAFVLDVGVIALHEPLEGSLELLLGSQEPLVALLIAEAGRLALGTHLATGLLLGVLLIGAKLLLKLAA